MVIQCKGLNNSLDIRTKRSNKKQNSRFSITDINNQDSRNLLKKFDNSPYLGWKIKQVYNESTETYFFLIKHINELTKSKKHVRPNFVKSGVNETIEHINETTGHVNKEIQSQELESKNETTTCVNKYQNFECVWY